MRDMATSEEEKRAARLRKARADAGFRFASEAARHLNVKPPTYLGHENGSRGFDFETAKRYARRFRVDPVWLYDGSAAKAPDRPEGSIPIRTDLGLPVLGEVAAGVWLEIDPFEPYEEPRFYLPIPIDPRFPAQSIYGLVVRGTSINRIAKEGDVLFCLDISAGWRPVDDDLLVIERISQQDGRREVTAKRYKQINGRIELRPESDDPRWQEPITVEGQLGEDDWVKALARVEWIYRNPRLSPR